ncbi:MAG TPA: PRC-barrel domain-containing protein [Rhodanobacteraceae bacterium]|nr:PRC-barrel domain-containing protein [Rhodanobacteraceae bacterium]
MDSTQRLSARELVGQPVHNLHGDKLGEVADVVIDTATGRVIYGALSVGGVLGVGEKLFAVPWSAMRIEADHDHRVLLDATPDRLKAASGFDKDHWPDDADTGFIERTHTNYA